MSWKVNSVKLVFELVDEETGELISEERVLGDDTKKTKKSSGSSRKPKDDGSNEPHLTLLDNKYQFNEAAIALTGFQPDDKVAIKFRKEGKTITPILLLDEKDGNRLTKTNTVSCRGAKREELLKYGENFVIKEHPSMNNTFVLMGDAPEVEDDLVEVPEELSSDEEIDDSIDLNEEEIDKYDFEF